MHRTLYCAAAMAAAVGVAAGVACAPPPAQPTARARYELGLMGQLEWLLGDWRSETGSWHFVAAGDKVYGVGFDPRYRQGFQVMIIEADRDPGRREGLPWVQIYDGPESLYGVSFKVERHLARFRQGMPEAAPFEVALSLEADWFHIATRRSTSKRVLGAPEILELRPTTGGRAPELERADIALAALTNERAGGTASTSGDTWANAFAPEGSYWCELCMAGASGRAAGGELSPRNNPGTFSWVPIESRREGDLGFTVGHISYRPRLSPGVWRGTYVTVWRRAGGDRWQVMFYARRSAIAALPEPQW